MAEIISLVFFTALGLIQLFEATKRLRNRRNPPLIRALDGGAELLKGLVFVALALAISTSAQAFINRVAGRDISSWVRLGLLLPLLLWLALAAGLWYARRRLAPPAKKTAPGEVEYQDVTGLVSPAAVANRSEAMIRGLEELGFRSVGLLRTSAPQSAEPDLIEVNEIFASPDGRTFAEAETFFACDAIALRTALPDGAIVDTTLLADRAPGTAIWKRWQTRLRWPRANRPGRGYYFERVDNTGAQAVWARHRERLEQIAARRGVEVNARPISGQPGMAGYIDLTRRGLRIAMDGVRLEMVILAVGLPTAIFLPLVLLLALGVRDINLWFALLWGVPLTGLAMLASRFFPVRIFQRRQR